MKEYIKRQASFNVTSATFWTGIAALWWGYLIHELPDWGTFTNSLIGFAGGVLIFWLIPMRFERRAKRLIDEVTG